MDSIQKGVEAFRLTIESFTGKSFFYAEQEVVLAYPVGTIQRLWERKVGQPSKSYGDSETETISQIYDVGAQLDYIAALNPSDPNTSIFSPRNILSGLQTGNYSDRWQTSLYRNNSDQGANVAVKSWEDLTGPVQVEGGENLWSARITAHLQIIGVLTLTEVPCITRQTMSPLPVKLNLRK